MPCPFPIFSQSDYLIQVVDINSNTEWQTVQIQISWLLQKPTDLDLHCLQRQGISGFSRTRVNIQLIFDSWELYLWICAPSLRICSVWSESSLQALWIGKDTRLLQVTRHWRLINLYWYISQSEFSLGAHAIKEHFLTLWWRRWVQV